MERLEELAAELRRVVDTHGNEALYGGSYGWASAGTPMVGSPTDI